MIDKANMPLYRYSRGAGHLVIDFIIESDEGICLLEEKSTNGKMTASRAVREGEPLRKRISATK